MHSKPTENFRICKLRPEKKSSPPLERRRVRNQSKSLCFVCKLQPPSWPPKFSRNAAGGEEERRFVSTTMHSTVMGFIVIALVFVHIKVVIDNTTKVATKVPTGKLVIFGMLSLIYLSVHIVEIYVPTRIQRTKSSLDFVSLFLGGYALVSSVYIVFEDFAVRAMVSALSTLVVMRPTYLVMTSIVHLKKIWDLRRLRCALARAQGEAEADAANKELHDLQILVGEEEVAAAKEKAFEKTAAVTLLRLQVAAAVVAAGVQQIP